METAPILLFVYNRLGHTMRLIESLQKNLLASESDLIVYSDGAKKDEDIACVDDVRTFIKSVNGFRRLKIIEREKNWGLANNVIDGVTETLKEYGCVIVLEDDLILSPYFLMFMNDALNTYRDEPRVCHIQACDFTKDPSLPDTFFIKWTGSWGWATWDRAWKLFNPNGKELLDELEKRNVTKEFDFNGKYGFTRMLRRQIEGKNDSWAIRWNASLFLQDALSLNTGKSLVQNVGFDGSGTNCGGGGLYASTLWQKPIPVKKADKIEECEVARYAFSKFYSRTNSIKAKAIRRIKRMLKGDFSA